jgi:transcriptional regulator with XRE-family HTH domain
MTVLRACRRLRGDPVGALALFRPPATGPVTELRVQDIAAWLASQRTREPIATLATRAGLSRYQVARFLSGRCQPRLHEFFALVDACTARLSDLVAALVDIDQVPTLTSHHARVAASRRLAFEEPWTSAVLSMLECLPSLPTNDAAQAVALALDLPLADVDRCVARLLDAGVVRQQQGRYVMAGSLVVDTDAVPDAARVLRRHWSEVAKQRIDTPGARDVFSYNVFSVSREDLARIARLQREHFQRIRTLIAESPAETVALLNFQLVEWDPQPSD